MPSADQVPVKSPHSRMQWHEWVVLIAGSTGSALRAVRPPNLHITPARCDLVRPLTRPGSCTAHPWPSWPRPFGRVYWQARSRSDASTYGGSAADMAGLDVKGPQAASGIG